MADKIATREAYGNALAELGEKYDIVVLDADLSKSTKTDTFRKVFPERHFNMGIAEANMMSVAAGLATTGKVVFASTFAMFASERACEQIRNSIGYPHLNVKIGATHAGITVGEDGATHHGAFDIAYFSCVPNLTIAAPRNEWQLRQMMYAASKADTPTVIRYPRGLGEGVEWQGAPFEVIDEGRGECLREGERVAIIAVGATAGMAMRAIERSGREVALYDMRYAKPLDISLIESVAKSFRSIITVEDGILRGGVGEAIAAHIAKMEVSPTIVNLGIDDSFVEHGTPEELYHIVGLDAEAIKKALS